MFFEIIQKNSRKARKENGIYVSSLIVAIVAFYIILSLENQDVMIFLKTMESDAVNRLLTMIPVLYGTSLFLVFFLVYYANKYQLEQRSHDFGLYLMFGMRKRKLFFMLIIEDMISSIAALIVGIPIAILLSEMISLATSRLIGLGIIGHHFTFSIEAILFTALGFIGVKLLAFILLSGKIARKEIMNLLKDTQEEKQKVIHKTTSKMKLSIGTILLLLAYGIGVCGAAWEHLIYMSVTVILGIIGTFLVFQGFSAFIEIILKKRSNKQGLYTFTFRQLQENVFLKSISLAISSLLVFMTLVCFAFGIAMIVSTDKGSHIMDFTFQNEGKEIEEKLNIPEVKDKIEQLFEVRMGIFFTEQMEENEEVKNTFDASELIQEVEKLEDSDGKGTLLNQLQYFTSPRLISVSGYNEILKLKGEEPIELNSNQIALYRNSNFIDDSEKEVLQKVLAASPTLILNGDSYQISNTFYYDNLVVDRSITIALGLIVTDEVFEYLLEKEDISSYWNMALKKEFVQKEGLMQAIYKVDNSLKKLDVEYESYLQNIGRRLFYVVGSSYLTIYLALIFLIIANTVISVQFLTQQKKTGKRYQTLIALGSDYYSLCQSARTQIKWCFGVPMVAAAISGFFGVQVLFIGLLPNIMKSQIMNFMVISFIVIVFLCVIEYIYMRAVMKLSDKHLLTWMRFRRSE